jgi:hypothetical protein
MVNVQALATVARSSSVILRVSIIILAWWNTCSDLDKVVFVCWVLFKASRTSGVEESLTKDGDVNLVWDINDDICLPLVAVYQVVDWKGDVSCVIGFVLLKDDVAPGLVEVSGCHTGVEGIVEERDELIFMFFSLFGLA